MSAPSAGARTGLGEWDDAADAVHPDDVDTDDPDAGGEAEAGEDSQGDPPVGALARGEPANGDEAPELYYPDVATFVLQQLAPMWRRSLDGHHRTWCPQWWRHAEAISRLEALWRAWEHLRLDPATGMSVWFRDHADPHMAVLLDADGPFKGCSPDKGHTARLDPLPVDEPPDGLFTITV